MVCFFQYDINDLVTYTADEPCGLPQVEFLNVDGIALNSVFF
jgi:hypothetical protein